MSSAQVDHSMVTNDDMSLRLFVAIASDMIRKAMPPFIITVAFLGIILFFYPNDGLKPTNLPLINGPRSFEISLMRSKRDFMIGAWETISERFKQAPGKAFRVIAEPGEVTILPPEYASEIRNSEHFSFTQAARRWYYGHLPGFEGFKEGTADTQIIKLVARHQLTHQLTIVTKPVSDECAMALQDIYTDNKDWHELSIKEANLQLMGRITSRVFLGEKLARNPDWLRITTTYSLVVFKAVGELRFWPSWMRSIVHWLLPNCRAARALVQEARDLINPLLKERRLAKLNSPEGEEPKWNDAIDWLETTSIQKNLGYDPTTAQLSLSVASIHSTTDFFAQATLDIATHPELIEPLRAEIVSVIGKDGWNKQSLYRLKLMDSVLKESQRLKPIAMASMRRFTTDKVKLSDGTVIPKNKFTLVSSHLQWDPTIYENPYEFDGYRFLRMRQQPGKENTSQLVTATVDHMGFGFGLHACPGRFFASEEIKIALCHMLLKYEMKLIEDAEIKPRQWGVNMFVNPEAKILIRRREEEISL